ncbi:hypothetical protein [Castellaniella sp.]|uniref:hypothetical protein n=1 Tax=Castellaniella sp. TaxID=1955812 RepID=UPI002AFF8785|nr:hypothetical protein [Castellaniella sp.]
MNEKKKLSASEQLAALERKADALRERMKKEQKARTDRRCILAGGALLDAAAEQNGEAARQLLRQILPGRLKPADLDLFQDILKPIGSPQEEMQ